MIRNYLKIALRNLKKDKQFTILNVIGLSAGIACTLLIYLWVYDEASYDRIFDNGNQVYQVMEHRLDKGDLKLWNETSGLAAQTVQMQNPEVLYSTSVAPPEWFADFTLSVGDKNIKAVGQYAGKDYFTIFPFKMLNGNPQQVLATKSAIVISGELAQRLFGTTSGVIGKGIKFQHGKDYFVSGVFEKTPVHSSQQFDFVMSFDGLADDPAQAWIKTWNNAGPHGYVMLKKGADVDAINKRIANIVTKYSGDTTRKIFLTHFADNYLQNTFVHGARVGGRGEYVKLFSVIAIFILFIACINFMNLSTAKAAGRMKEVGIKKVVGAERSQLIIQFLSESVLMALLTTALAMGIAWLLLPQFNQLTGKDIHLSFNIRLILMLVAIALFTGIVSGSYPAFYLSKFNPLAVLKGKLKSSVSELIARKGLVVFQFTISVVLIVAVMVVYRQIQFIQSTSPGYNKDNVVRFSSDGAINGHEDEFATQLKALPGVVDASLTLHSLVGRNYGTANVAWDGNNEQNTYFEGMNGGYNFIETMGMTMAQGRSFQKNFGNDGNNVIFNETAIKMMGLKDPIGKSVKLYNSPCKIIGVVKDFHFESLHEAVKPLFMQLAGGSSPWNKMIVRIKGTNQKQTLAQIQQLYERYNPGFPFTYSFLDEAYQKQYENESRVSVLSEYFSILAIMISCLGLFGLVAFTAQKRQKEIGIRKVVGASVNGIAIMLTRDFLKLVLIAAAIAVPLSWYMMSSWLNGYAYRISIGPMVFVIACCAVMLITILTVSYEAIKAALANPVKSLRSE